MDSSQTPHEDHLGTLSGARRPRRRGRLLVAAVQALVAVAAMVASQASVALPDCKGIAALGRLTETGTSKLVENDIYKRAFCSAETRTTEQYQTSAKSAGIDWYSLDGTYDGNDLNHQTDAYFKAVCKAVESGHYKSDDRLQYIEKYSSDVAEIAKTCLRLPGVNGWYETDVNREAVTFHFPYIAGEGVRELTLARKAQVGPPLAFSSCSATPARGAKLDADGEMSFTCYVNKAFKNQSVNAALTFAPRAHAVKSAYIAARLQAWVKPDPKKKNGAAVASQPPAVPPFDYSRYPQLSLWLDGVRSSNQPVGKWIEIDQGADLEAGNRSAPAFGLSIDDHLRGFDTNDVVTMIWETDLTQNQIPRVTTTAVPHTIVIERGLEPAAPTDLFTGYGSTYHDHRVDTWYNVSLTIDATKVKYFGLQAETTGACTQFGPRVTALPGGPAVTLPIRSSGGPGACTLRLRLCTTKKAEAVGLYRDEDACN